MPNDHISHLVVYIALLLLLKRISGAIVAGVPHFTLSAAIYLNFLIKRTFTLIILQSQNPIF